METTKISNEKVILKEVEKITKKASKVRLILENYMIDNDGSLIACSSHRVLKIANLYEPQEKQLVNGVTGVETNSVSNYPNIDRLIREHSNISVKIPVKPFYNMVATLKKDRNDHGKLLKNRGINVTFENNTIKFTQLDKEAQTLEATLIVESANYPLIEFTCNTNYLTDIFMFYKKLKYDTIRLEYDSKNRPLQFTNGSVMYMVAPIRKM